MLVRVSEAGSVAVHLWFALTMTGRWESGREGGEGKEKGKTREQRM